MLLTIAAYKHNLGVYSKPGPMLAHVLKLMWTRKMLRTSVTSSIENPTQPPSLVVAVRVLEWGRIWLRLTVWTEKDGL